ncbi:MAG: NAD-dependent epimerase/dehydratase family protein [Rhodoblastus sp.]
MIHSSFWRERRVFLTGHTGFAGAWACLMLERLCARTTGFGPAPAAGTSLYALARAGENLCDVRGDVCDGALLDGALRAADPDIVIHLAHPVVRAQGKTPARGKSNPAGCADVLEATLGAHSVQAAVFVSPHSDYVALDWIELVAQSHGHGAHSHIVSLHCPPSLGDEDVSGGVIDAGFGQNAPHHVLDALYGVLLLAERAACAADGLARAWSFAFDTHAARPQALGYAPLLNEVQARQWMQDWRQALEAGQDMRAVTLEQIDRYLGQRVRLTTPFAPIANDEVAPLRAVGA